MSLKTKIESILFVAVKPLSLRELSNILSLKSLEIEEAMKELMSDYNNEGRGINIIQNGKQYQMLSDPNNAEIVQAFLKDETSGELSQPSLETLSIIAYRAPISKLELERIRGINCSLIIRNLLLRGLITDKFDRQKDEHYYSITNEFIRFLGINDIRELKDYDKLNKMETIQEVMNSELEA